MSIDPMKLFTETTITVDEVIALAETDTKPASAYDWTDLRARILTKTVGKFWFL